MRTWASAPILLVSLAKKVIADRTRLKCKWDSLPRKHIHLLILLYFAYFTFCDVLSPMKSLYAIIYHSCSHSRFVCMIIWKMYKPLHFIDDPSFFFCFRFRKSNYWLSNGNAKSRIKSKVQNKLCRAKRNNSIAKIQ